MAYRVVHYINQFYGGKGGEEVADFKPSLEQGPAGPGSELQKLFDDEARVIGTIICGDGYYAEHIEKARAECLKIVEELKPDLFIAGPAFNAGRYGVACGDICAAVVESLGIPSVTGMFPEKPRRRALLKANLHR
ncbi:glycine/betaine/sarcosine/D-proline family reductase selenoprotein B [Acetomicrobium sp.]|uniref:glycine/betaine/sarcosine/D-proline family reductase selenoprotein B n=1 Tax=Acetomicrobium sp. TaxID=1872099 RepID=UPI002FCCA79D